MTPQEFREALVKLGIPCNGEQIHELFARYDDDGTYNSVHFFL